MIEILEVGVPLILNGLLIISVISGFVFIWLFMILRVVPLIRRTILLKRLKKEGIRYYKDKLGFFVNVLDLVTYFQDDKEKDMEKLLKLTPMKVFEDNDKFFICTSLSNLIENNFFTIKECLLPKLEPKI